MKSLAIWFFKDIWMVWAVVWTMLIWKVDFWQAMIFGAGMVACLVVEEILKDK